MTIDTDIRQGLALLPIKMGTLPARVTLHAINLQENPQRLVQQVGGPARGDYQFEEGGGVTGVLNHAAVKNYAAAACKARGVVAQPHAVYLAIGTDPILAAALARLLLWTDSHPMPSVGDSESAWQLYLSAWRPGAAKRDLDGLHIKFLVNYGKAVAAVQA